MTEATAPNPFSFAGWSFKEWAKQNKDDLKSILLLVIGYNYVAGFSWQSFLVSVGVLVGKLVVDSFDYWVSS